MVCYRVKHLTGSAPLVVVRFYSTKYTLEDVPKALSALRYLKPYDTKVSSKALKSGRCDPTSRTVHGTVQFSVV